MTTPIYWRRPSFGVAETADMIGSTEDALRTWIARNPLDDFSGEKQAGRIWLTGRDGYFYRLVMVLAAYGVPVRTAMYSAGSIAEFGPPVYRYLIVTTAAGVSTFRSTDSAEPEGPVLVVPLLELYDKHMDACREAYATESA